MKPQYQTNFNTQVDQKNQTEFMQDIKTPLSISNPNDSKCQPVDLSFKNISYFVNAKESNGKETSRPRKRVKVEKMLLNNVSGIFKAGQLTAIMGASGAGKTTLLNVLAGRISSRNLSGTMDVNGKPYNFNNFGDFANYVTQKDILIETLTVRQTLQLAANLKLNASYDQKQKRILSLVKKFKLQKCLDTTVGGQLLKGISGGQKKRTSIAFQLISDPSVLVLDEPTSGLDSLTSFIIIQYLKQLARDGKTIFMTIHQPSTQIYELFDQLMLMVEGRFIYQGKASLAPEYFSKSFGQSCPQQCNPADFFMSIMHQESSQNVEMYPKYFQNYEKQLSIEVNKDIEKQLQIPIEKRTIDVSFCTSLGVLVKKDLLNTLRNPMLLTMRIVTTVFISIFTSGVFYRFNGDFSYGTNWFSLTGFMFFMAISTMMSALAPITMVFPAERDVFLKESGSKLYSTFSYFLSRNVVELPAAVIFPLVQTLIMYWFVGLSSTVQQFWIYYLVTYLITLNGSSLGLMIGSIILDQKSVGAVTPCVLLPVILFSGFFKNTANLPVWLGWIQYISPIKYGFSAWIQNEVEFASSSALNTLNLDTGLWMNVYLLAVLAVGFRIVSLIFLELLKSRQE